ncbi:MAG: phage holin family protein [Defluviitaleaceae bacterium]|nr:phage holin family protein [Defluviitaleaceae bacterium]
MLLVKAAFFTLAGATGGILAQMVGGYDHLLQALIVFMAIDFITGWLAAAVFKSSKKTETGRLSSAAGFRGLIKKGCILLMIVVAVHLDGLLGTNNITRSATIIAFSLNELLSILENMDSMGVKLPDALTSALELLGKSEHKK